jgi:hypothetical protein
MSPKISILLANSGGLGAAWDAEKPALAVAIPLKLAPLGIGPADTARGARAAFPIGNGYWSGLIVRARASRGAAERYSLPRSS